MPPRDNRPNLSPNYKTAREAVDWYRSLGQDSQTVGLSEELLHAAVLVEQKGDGIYLTNREGEVDKSQPAILDSANMYEEAARSTSQIERALQYRRRAQRIAKSISENPEATVSLRVDALMDMIDCEFANLYDQYYADLISGDDFDKSWQICHEYSLDRFMKELVLEEDRDDFSAGKFGEWFFLNTQRHIQLEQETQRDSFIRSTFSREDCATRHSQSGNFDIAVDSKANDNWRVNKKFQIKVILFGGQPQLHYDEDIQPRVIRFRKGESFDSVVGQDTEAMLAESRSMSDERITLNYASQAALQDALTRTGSI